jgi:SpoVK/Ycf46/Vps4 family AAA+-type ATPase
MASASQLKALLRTHFDGDRERFLAVAQQIAAEAERRGQKNLAGDLKTILEGSRFIVKSGLQMSPGNAERQIDALQLGGVVTVSFPTAKFSEMVMDDWLRGRLERVVMEQKQRDKLESHGLSPRRKLLLVGAPGTGKTMAATALAGHLHLPLYTILLDGLITKYMGETAAKLRMVFNFMAKTNGVFLFDEFDAIGGKRSSDNDIGEMRRVLNTFLVLLEQEETRSLVVTATNHPELLDEALFRRFDDILQFPMPTDPLVEKILKGKLPNLRSLASEWPEVLNSCKDLSFAEIARACDDAAKEAVLMDEHEVPASKLLKYLRERKNIPDSKKN